MAGFDKRSLTSLLAVGVLILLVTACGTPSGYRAEVNQWVGQPADAVISEWGRPTEQVGFDDGTGYIAYRGTQIPGGQTTLLPFNTAERTCWTRFMMDAEGVITSVRFRGNGCRR